MNSQIGQIDKSRLGRVPTTFLFLLVLAVTLVKSGVGQKVPVVWDPATYPLPVSDRGQNSSYGLRTLGYVFGLDSQSTYLVMSLAVTIICVVLAAAAIIKSPWGNRSSRRIVMVVVLGGPFMWTILREYHGIDPWVLGGSVVVASFAWGRVGLFVGLALMLLGNPEQAFVAGVALLIATFMPSLRQWRKRALLVLFTAFTVLVVLALWTASLGDDSRLALIQSSAIEGGGYFVSWGLLGIYGGLGLIPLFAYVLWTGDRRFISGLALVVAFLIPIAATMVTLDQSRVLVGTSTLLGTAVTLRAVPSLLDWFQRHDLDGQVITVVIVLLLPVVHVEYPSVIRPPLLIVSETLGGFL